MAIGDYSKTTYANGVAPAINATNLNNNENKTKELDSGLLATQNIIKPVPLTGRIAEYNGDGVPEIPDRAEGVAYRQSVWSTVDGWVAAGGTVSVSNGSLVADSTSTDLYISKTGLSISGATNRLVCLIFNGPQKTGGSLDGEVRYATSGHGISASYRRLFTIPKDGGPVYLDMGTLSFGGSDWITSTITSIRIDLGGTSGDQYKISGIYIGPRAYDSKILSLSGANHLTNNGLLPVNGPYGKMLQGNGAQYAEADGPVFGTTGTVYHLIRPSRVDIGTQVLYTNRDGSNNNGVSLVLQNTSLSLSIRGATSANALIAIGTLAANTLYTLVYTISGTTVTYWLNGVMDTVTLAETPTVGASNLHLLSNLGGTVPFFGDLSIGFTSDIWTPEEVAAWSNDPRAYDSKRFLNRDELLMEFATKAAGSIGVQGQLAMDTTNLYGCIATNTWRKIPWQTI